MHHRIGLLLVIGSACLGIPAQTNERNGNDIDEIERRPEARTNTPNQRQYSQGIPFGLGFLEPQLQINPLQQLQPQFLFYGGAPGQPVLLNPGSPPGNFLVPQPVPAGGPNVFYNQGPPRPVFVAGYPKPAHIPPIDKDAEEIPTNPEKIPPLPSTSSKTKPEKLETFNEVPSEGNNREELDKPIQKPGILRTNGNFHPGQRFFILNGNPLFSYPGYTQQPYGVENPEPKYLFQPAGGPQVPQRFATPEYGSNVNPAPQQIFNDFQNSNSFPSSQEFTRSALENPGSLFVSPSNTENFRTAFLRNSAIPLQISPEQVSTNGKIQIKVDTKDFQLDGLYPKPGFRTNQPQFDYDDSVVVDAIDSENNEKRFNSEIQDDAVAAPPTKPVEPSMSQAGPGAIALAGTGGVASAAPRATALTGKGGLAVSSPRATAVAGPSDDEQGQKKRKNVKDSRQKS